MDLNDFLDQHSPDDTNPQAIMEELQNRARGMLIEAGTEAERFLQSALGLKLIEDAAKELQRYRTEMEELIDRVDESDIAREYKRLMFHITVIKTAINWLLTAVVTGNNSIPKSRYDEEYM